MWDSLWVNARIVTMTEVADYNAIAVKDGLIAWLGKYEDLVENSAKNIYDVKNKLITPGFIDCHTHLVYGGNRANEFEMRLNGAGYEEIARAGGGIVSTVKATREVSEEDLFAASLKRLQVLMMEGVTGVEIKSGYGLDLPTEKKMLRVATKLRDKTGLRVQRTFLGAHALPVEYKGKPDAYIDFVCNEMMPQFAAEGLIDAVDAFCENIGFSPEQTERVFKKAQELRLPIKLHAEQLSNQKGAELTAKYKGLSADHLEYIDEEGVKAMAAAGTVAVLLPGAYYFLRETKKPPIDLFRKYKVPMAIATDLNPGSSPVNSLLLIMNMACTLFNMTPQEALQGVTINAAKALGWNDCGILAEGMRADFVLWDVESIAELSYRIGFNPCSGVVRNGVQYAF